MGTWCAVHEFVKHHRQMGLVLGLRFLVFRSGLRSRSCRCFRLPEIRIGGEDHLRVPEQHLLDRDRRQAGPRFGRHVFRAEEIQDLDSLPFPRWDLVTEGRKRRFGIQWSSRPVGGGFPLLASRGCPEFCTYCPHRILAGYRARSISNIVDEIERLCDQVRRPYVIFRDPLFSEQRDRCIELCDEIEARGLDFTFEAETRLDRLDVELLDRLHKAGFRAMSFGVESLDPATLKKSGRRPIPQEH